MQYENLQNNQSNINLRPKEVDINQINKNNSKKNKWKYCLVQVFIFFALSLAFLVNFICTYDNFKENKYIHMSPQLICSSQIKEHNECLNKHRNQTDPREIIEECMGANMRLQTCYDQVDIYNRKCFMYLSEFDKCVRDNIGVNTQADYLRNKCVEEINNIHLCTLEYMVFDPFILLQGLDINYKKDN
jgi:hypothetical protein